MRTLRQTIVEDHRGLGLLTFLLILITFFVVTGFLLSYKRLEGQPPQLRFSRDFTALGRTPSLTLTVQDAGTGIKRLIVVLKQKDQEIVLAEQQFDGPSVFKLWGRGPEHSLDLDLGKLISEKCKPQEGPATLIIDASDFALRNFLRGNRTHLQKDFSFRLYPPRLEVLSGQHYINQGGSECVVYKVSPETEISGVQAGPNFFPGFPAGLADPGIRFCLFGFAYNIPPASPLKVIARDAAGNEAVAGFWFKLFPKPFRSRKIQLEDSFLQKVVPDILSRTSDIKDQGDLLKTFLEINNRLRQQNHRQIANLAEKSPPHFLWNGPFVQLSNSQVESLFADHRDYVYQGKEVDHQDHVGFDLSVTQQYPIEAANDGTVVLADYFGIYGNAVIVDHGCGLLSLYGHMSSIGVKEGQPVKKRDVLGRSGATGLAGGDHLHFGMFLQGIPVNPTEWWDEKWIKDHVLDRISAAGGAKP